MFNQHPREALQITSLHTKL